MGKMTMEQARKMVAGTLKGNSNMAKAMRELAGGDAVEEVPSSTESPPSSTDRGAKTSELFRRMDQAF